MAEPDLAQLYRLLAANIPRTSVYIFDRQLRVVLAGGDHNFRNHGWVASEMIGRLVLGFIAPEDRPQVEAHYRAALGGTPAYFERRRDGKVYECSVLPVGEAPHGFAMMVAQDVTASVGRIDELTTLALRDEMTGLYNRRGFTVLAPNRIAVAVRQKEVVFMGFADLDGLKRINDTLGHAMGDTAIKQASTILQHACRATDLTARLGGDEFVFLAIGTRAPSAIRMRVALEVGALNDEPLRPFALGVSMAFTEMLPGEDLACLMGRADAAMYQKKRARKAPAASQQR